MKRIITITIALLSVAQAFALSKATIRQTYKDNRVFTKHIELKNVGNNTYRVEIPKNSISKEVAYIDIVIDEMCAKKGDDGYFVMPDGKIGTFTRDNGLNSSRNRNPLKLFGIKKGNYAIAGIVKGLELEYSTVVSAKNGKYEIYPSFDIGSIGRDVYENIVVDFVKLQGEDANYSGMARAYRNYQLERGEVKPLKDRVKERPALAYAADSIVVRVKHGTKVHSKIEDHIPNVNEPKVVMMNSFEKLKNMIIELKKMGIEKLEICSVAWNTKGHDGRYPQLFPVEPEFGGEAKLREAIAEAKKAGYQIFGQTNYTDAYKCADCWSESYTAKRPDGSMRRGGIWGGGRAYEVCQVAMLEQFAEKDFAKMKELGFAGTHHIDVFSAITPYPCFDKNHPATRKDNAIAMKKIAKLAHKYFGGFGSECGYDHIISELDFALYTSAYPRWANKTLIDDQIPLWQIVYNGIVMSTPHYAAVDYTTPRKKNLKNSWPWFALSTKESRLKLYEAGCRPAFYWDDYNDLTRIKRAYDEYQPLKHLQFVYIYKHEKIADNVYRTLYENGAEIITNYGKTDFVYNDKTIAAEDFKYIEPTLWQKIKYFFKK